MAVSNVTGLILAGGRGLRMGGADKGLIPYQGQPLVASVLARLAPQVGGLIISANRNLATYRAFGHPVVTDELAGFQGPLAGLASALAICPTPWLVSVPCDCPALPLDLVARLYAAAQSAGAALAVAQAAGRLQPAFMLCRREKLPALSAFLARGERRASAWCLAEGALPVDFPDAAAFANFNTPDDLGASSDGTQLACPSAVKEDNSAGGAR
ncbi:MAG: molybdenum cofactor guanylyltransferase [Rhodocyclaceae bacterium]|nr:molybdenum cofactor guanylyltransferase [Rhodocyclaceae bacterium]